MKWWQYCVVAVVVTTCVTGFMMVTANNPSADDFWRGSGGGVLGYLAGAGTAAIANQINKKSAAT